MDYPDWGYSSFSSDDDSSPNGRKAQYFELGNAFAEKAKTIEAIALLTEYLEQIDFVDDPDLLVIAAESALDVLCVQGRFDEALALASLSMKKLEPWANFHLGYLYKYRVSVLVRVGRFSEGIQDCKTAVALFESDEQYEWAFPLRNQCGELLFKTECFMEATKTVSPIAFGQNKDCQIVVRGIALSIAGKSEFEMGNFQGAIDFLQESIKILKPLEHAELGQSACYLAKALQATNRLNEARSIIERVLQVELQPAAKVELQNRLEILLETQLTGFSGLPEKSTDAA